MNRLCGKETPLGLVRQWEKFLPGSYDTLEGLRTLVLKWVSPMMINMNEGNMEDVEVVIVPVKK